METKKLKTLEEAELQVVLFDNDDIVTISCLATGAKVTMADGSVKNIEDICEGDVILTFDHEAGCFVGSRVHFVYQGEAAKCAFTLRFTDGTELSIVGEHDLFEKESMKYVTLTEKNAEQFVGKHFYNASCNAFVELISVKQETEATDYYEIYTSRNLNCIANGMLNVADDVEYLLNIYEFNENLKANEAILKEDIEKYGLFTFSEKYGSSKEEYKNWNQRYINIAVGKGLISWDELWQQHTEYLCQRDGNDNSECA